MARRTTRAVVLAAVVLLLPLLAAPASAQGTDLDRERFITSAYQGLLGRAPEQAGLAHWIGRLEAGEDPSTVLATIADSEEHRRHVVGVAYDRFLERRPDAQGLAHWADAISDTLTLTGLRAQLLSSDEFHQRFGGGTVEGFLRAAYQEVFGRQPDARGLQHWTDQLQGGLSRLQVATFLLSSEEAQLQPDLSIITAQPSAYAETSSLGRLIVRTDTDVIPSASAIRLTIDGRRVAGATTFGPGEQTLVYNVTETPTWVEPGTVEPAIVTVYGYDGSTVGRADHYFFYRRPVTAVGDASTETRETTPFPGTGQVAYLEDVRVASQPGFDRVVFEFSGAQDLSYRVGYADVLIPPSGMPVDVAGPAQIEVVLSPGSAVDLSGAQPRETYTGPDRSTPGGTEVITELVQVEDFESVLVWAIGTEERVPFGVEVLQDPLRLVVDVRHP